MDERELLKLIKNAIRYGWTEVYLSNKGLRSITPEIAQLNKVKALYLDGNDITSLPIELCELTNLMVLYLGKNKLISMPSEIGQLTNLKILNLRWNSLTSLPSEISQLTNLTSLSLGNNRHIKLPTELYVLTTLQNLNLNSCGLTLLPSEIGQLKNLTIPEIGGNSLTSLPPELWELTNLQSLNLGACGLTLLPPEIRQLKNLTSLEIGGNSLTSLPPELWELTKLQKLNLSACGLTSLPSEIGQLKNLTSLNIGGNSLGHIPPELWELTNLESLNLNACGLTLLPPEIGQLKNLTSLSIGGNSLTSLPPELWELRSLQSLDLSGCRLTSLPSEIDQLTSLTSLDLGGNRFMSLPKELWELSALKNLGIDGNRLASLPSEIRQLTNLNTLALGGNRLTSLPPEIVQLTNLTVLTIGGNQLKSLPADLGCLSNLMSLQLNGIEFGSLPAELWQLSNLKRLDVGSIGLTSLPPEIGQLVTLTSLGLGGNQLESLPPELWQLTELKNLYLGGNKLKSIAPEVVNLKKLKTLDLTGNLLESPPWDVAKKGVEAINDYFRQLRHVGKDYLYEAKLLIIGEAGAGKTSLMKKIEDHDYVLREDEESTKGINIIEWCFPIQAKKDFRLNMWDFGGQEIYHATHQFFLTKRSLYALVADSRKEDTDFYYWLNVVEILSDNSPVLIIKNEKQDRHREINENALRGEFSNIKDFLTSNLATNRGLEEIEEEIKHHAKKLPHVGVELPKTWVKVREPLEKEARNYINLNEYFDICEKNGFKQEKDKFQLSGYLHDIGVCLHFQDDPLLRKTVILKPEWSTSAVYKLLDNPVVMQNKGRFSRTSLESIWDEQRYSGMQAELLRLMENFKLCYKIEGTEDYIAPELMSRNQPHYEWDRDSNLILRYGYEFMPKGVITQFIVAMHPWIANQDWVWREGVILEKDETRAEVIEYYSRREIKVRIVGKHKKELMTIIVYELDRINSSYNRLTYSKFIPCNCEVCRTNQEPHFYSFDILRDFFANQQYEIQCQRKPYEMVNVLGLIDDVVDIRKLRAEGEESPTVVEGDWSSWYEDSNESYMHAETELEKSGKKRFKVALSFPGERRKFAEDVMRFLVDEFDNKRIFYDRNFEAELARIDLDTYLQKIYHDDSELIVVFLCAEHEEKEWCGLEWRAIRDLIKNRKASDIMPVRFDDTHIQGLFSIDGYVNARDRTAREIAELIIQRYRMNQQNADG